MKKTLASASVALGLAAIALTGCKPTTFANCTEMNKVHKGGVGIPGAVDVRTGGGKAKYTPKWGKALYDANAKSDRDKDRIACEQ